ncbi:MAG: hypothetical protein OHK0052_14180 [Anaerolineales bacterium]
MSRRLILSHTLFAALLLLGACSPEAATPAPTAPPAASPTATVGKLPTAPAITTAPPTTTPELTNPPNPSPIPASAPSITLTFLTPKPKAANDPQMEGYTFKPPPQFAAIVQIEAAALPAAPANRNYLAWLIAEDDTMQLLGVLEPNPQGSARLLWEAPNGENLLTRYVGARVTLEDTRSAQAPGGTILYESRLNPATLAAVRRLFVSNIGDPITPRNTSFMLGLYQQTDLALQHVQNAVNAAAIGAVGETRTHLEHVINILEGVQGARYGDYTGDGVAQNPGDGFGVSGYAEQTIQLLQQLGYPTNDAALVANLQTLEDLCVEILRIDTGDLRAIQDRLKTLRTESLTFQNSTIANIESAAYELIRIPLEEVNP